MDSIHQQVDSKKEVHITMEGTMVNSKKEGIKEDIASQVRLNYVIN